VKSSVTLYGIPTCGTCKKAIGWMKENDLEYQFVNTRQDPPSKPQIQRWVKEIGWKPLRNTSGGSYRALGDQKNDWSDQEWIDAFAKDPMLIKRPVIEVDQKVVAVGFRDPDLVAKAIAQ